MAKKRKRNSDNHNHHHNHRPEQEGQPHGENALGSGDDDGESGLLFEVPADLAQWAAALGDDFEIVGEDDDLAWPDDDAGPLPTLSLEAVIQLLLSDEDIPPAGELSVLSDLSRQGADFVRERWRQIAPDRRLAVMEVLVLLSQENALLDLGRFLRLVLDDDDTAVREQAVRGLWEDGEPDLIGPLLQILRDDPAIEVRAAAATTLGRYVLDGELEEVDAALAIRVEEALLAVLHNEQEPLLVRRRALESVAYSGEAGVRQLIEDAYYSPDEEMRISALFAMGRSADVRWRPLVRAELRNPSSAVRAEAAYACGELEAQGALRDLLSLLDDRHENVRLASIFALGRIGGSIARDTLEAIALGDNPDEAEAAQDALEEMQIYESAGIALFDEPLDDEDEWDHDPADGWYDWDERELGAYAEDDADYADSGEDET